MRRDQCRVTSESRRRKHVRKKITVLTLSIMLFALCVPAEAPQWTKIPKIGFLGAVHLPAPVQAPR
jgi:hypothetical protein